jgi:hypothetical protein
MSKALKQLGAPGRTRHAERYPAKHLETKQALPPARDASRITAQDDKLRIRGKLLQTTPSISLPSR